MGAVDCEFSRNVPHNARGKPLEKGFHMSGNTDKAAGMAIEVAGKVKQDVGKIVGSERLQGEGARQELKGDAQQLKRDAKNALNDSLNKVADVANKKLC
jgi:uncharacterized protein YjbJ (UPF0337 family)